MLQDLNVTLTFYFVTFTSVLLGGIFVIVASTAGVSDPSDDGKRGNPAPLLALTAASVLPLAGLIVEFSLPPEIPLSHVLYKWCVGGAGFVCVLISLVLSIRHSGRGKISLMTGSIVLLAIDIIGLAIYLYSLTVD